MLSRTYFLVSASAGDSRSARYLRSRATLSTTARKPSMCRSVIGTMSAAVGLLPVLSVLSHDGHLFERALVEAARIHAVAVGMGARDVERLHAACRAEQVSRRTGVERVGGERLRAGHEPEAFFRHDQMEVARSRTHRAVALGDLEARGGLRLATHAAAVAASPMRDHRATLTQNPPARRRALARAGAARTP